ncbi:hypothetical protein [Aliarcobacter cryaerophilus]|uniref:DUF3649 domain-containing protein n=1 Tax=Aliarcobacter cryaerophilus TaxID=28198 RepID=A0A2S9TER5_9BACT|nr:hypothetical protein [Aliarcobacter cryaerophilus]PRM97321.1 hypothetical protein CJ670_05260 [Arcobacter cryaerophilus gv. crypticus]
MTKYLNKLKVAENSGTKIGLFRTICSIFGGLIVAYLSMTFLVFIIPGTAGESIIVSLLLNTLTWAIIALWISLSKTKYIALLRCVVPSLIFGILLIILYNI